MLCSVSQKQRPGILKGGKKINISYLFPTFTQKVKSPEAREKNLHKQLFEENFLQLIWRGFYFWTYSNKK